jgi:hypothetical protein
MTEKLINIKMKSWKVLASLAIPSSDNTRMKKRMNPVVSSMAKAGVPFVPTLEKT